MQQRSSNANQNANQSVNQDAIQNTAQGGEIPIPEELAAALHMFLTRRSFITISFIGENGNTQHWWSTRKFPHERMLPSLKRIMDDVKEKELKKPGVSQDFRAALARNKGRL